MRRLFIAFLMMMLILNIFLIYKHQLLTQKIKSTIGKENAIARFYHNTLLRQVSYGHNLELRRDRLSGLVSIQTAAQKRRIVLRVTELNCSSCIEAELGNLKRWSKKATDFEIVLLTSFSSETKLALFRERYGINFETLNVPIDQMHYVKAEEVNAPYYFTVDDSDIIKNLFIPEKNLPALTEEYLTLVGSRD